MVFFWGGALKGPNYVELWLDTCPRMVWELSGYTPPPVNLSGVTSHLANPEIFEVDVAHPFGTRLC